MTMINLSMYKDEVDNLLAGETMRLDHGDCEAGADTRQRLYLTRVLADATKVVGYCHNCNQGGVMTEEDWSSYRDQAHAEPYRVQDNKTTSEVVPPTHMVKELREWPTHAKSWALKNKLMQHDINQFRLRYDPSSDRVYLPRYRTLSPNFRGVLSGYQLRLVNGRGPKYLTVTKDSDVGYSVLHNDRPVAPWGTQLVIVEDLVSGIHIYNAFKKGDNMAVLVNYGVKINPLAVDEATNYDQVTVWLDNDSRHVVSQARDYARTVELYTGKHTKVVHGGSDPKHYTSDEICDRMEQLWTS